MKFKLHHFMILLLTLVLIGNWNGRNSAAAENVILPTNSSLHNVPYKDWLAKRWEWRAGIPKDMNPEENFRNPDVKKCSAMQDGPVWFMPAVAPGKGEVHYKCEIPYGKDIMFALTSTDCDTGTEGNLSDQELKDCAFNIKTPLNNIEMSVDGKKVDVSQLGDLIQTDFFNTTYPTNPVTMWGPIQPGTYKSIGQGYFLFVHGLSPGKHVIETNVVDILKGKMTPELPAPGVYEILVK